MKTRVYASRKERYHLDRDFADKYRAKSYAKLLRAGLVKNPSVEILQRYGLEQLAQDLGLCAVARPVEKPLTLDAWTPKCSGCVYTWNPSISIISPTVGFLAGKGIFSSLRA
jgi:hypothetical protein